MEYWVDVIDYEGFYEVSNFGRVRSKQRNGTRGGIRVPVNGKRYLILNMSKEGKKKTRRIHQLVFESFNGRYDRKNFVIDHIDNNPHNNNLTNLRLVSHRENVAKDVKNTSGYTGVSWHKPLSKWRTQAVINGVKKHLGYYDCKLRAAYEYNKAIKNN